jgi:hypothetical protein
VYKDKAGADESVRGQTSERVSLKTRALSLF